MQPVRVVGAGVVGLSCGIRLAEAGFPVEVLARDLPQATTSAVAGGLWMPYRAEPAARVDAWGLVTLHELVRLPAEAGVLLRRGVVLHRTPPARPSWADLVGGLVDLEVVSDPAPGYAYGLAATVPMVDMARYLPYLLARLERAGGRLVRTTVSALPADGVVVNAAGLAGAALAGDPDVRPVRGQVVVLDNPGLTQWLVDEHEVDGELTYVLPRAEDVVVGGSATEGDARMEPDPLLAERILERAQRLVTALIGARVRAHRVGLRPGRSSVRVEAVPHGRGLHVHCYGHGGAGVTLSWGCADEVLELVSG
ncbi:MAG TPA: FAD-dependent oxidoreductase [Mycobacteriales bacterium]|jgi:D-amino-acid oxidase|nr:FAD-dependent oxidoreductase [Mycobacteriales bacterium]